MGEREVNPRGEAGEIPLGVCAAEGPVESGCCEPLSEIFVSEALLAKRLEPMLFFCLNFSSQLVLFVFK